METGFVSIMKSYGWGGTGSFGSDVFIYPNFCLCCCPEIGAGSIDWAQLSRFHLMTDRIQSQKCCVLNKNKVMGNVQKHKNCFNLLSSQIFIYSSDGRT
jgi:hypothetical protein